MPLFGPRTPTTPRSASLRSSGRPIGGTEIERAKGNQQVKMGWKGNSRLQVHSILLRSNVECSYFDESLSGTYIESGIGPFTLEPFGVGAL